MRWLTLVLVVFASVSFASPCAVYFEALHRALPRDSRITSAWSDHYRVPESDRVRLEETWEKEFPLGYAASVRSGINQDGHLKDPVRSYRATLPDGSLFPFTAYGMPYRKQGKWFVDFLPTEKVLFASPVLRRFPFADFYQLLYPQFFQRLRVGQAFVLPQTAVLSSTAEHSLYAVTRLTPDAVWLRSMEGRQVRMPAPHLFLHDVLTDPSLKTLWEQMELDGGRATLLRVLSRRGGSASGDFLRLDRWPKQNETSSVLAFLDPELKHGLRSLEKQGHPVLLASGDRHYRGLYVNPRSSSWKQMGGRTTFVGGEPKENPALVFSPNFDRYTLSHERRHVYDTQLHETWSRDLREWEAQGVLKAASREADTLLRFLGEQRAYADEWDRFEGERRAKRSTLVGFSDRFSLQPREEVSDALRERMLPAFASYSRDVALLFDRLRSEDFLAYTRLRGWLAARALPSPLVGLPAGLPAHFPGN